jgi:hypothetical protein
MNTTVTISVTELSRIAESAAEAAMRSCRRELLGDIMSAVKDVAAAAVAHYRIAKGEEPSYISKNEAYRRYSYRLVERWVREGLVSVSKDGVGNMKCRISTIALEKAANMSNYASYFSSLRDEPKPPAKTKATSKRSKQS